MSVELSGIMTGDDDDDDLFSKRFMAYARGSDPSTSHEAAESLTPEQVAIREREALYAVGLTGREGAICSQVEAMTRRPWKSVSNRLAPLRRKGLIEWRQAGPDDQHDSEGWITRMGPSGRNQRVNWITEAGKAWLRMAKHGEQS